MKYDPRGRHRRSIRLKGFDYGQNAAYFITLVTRMRECLFGDIVDGEMRLNPAGEIVTATWFGLESRFSMVRLDEYIVMPNHFHGIIVIADDRVRGDPVRGDPVRGDPVGGDPVGGDPVGGDPVGATLVVAPDPDPVAPERAGINPAPTDPVAPVSPDNQTAGSSKRTTLGDIVGAFKSISTHEYVLAVRRGELPPFAGKIWQRNYYERVIRNETEWARIKAYIQANPARWADDRENPAGR